MINATRNLMFHLKNRIRQRRRRGRTTRDQEEKEERSEKDTGSLPAGDCVREERRGLGIITNKIWVYLQDKQNNRNSKNEEEECLVGSFSSLYRLEQFPKILHSVSVRPLISLCRRITTIILWSKTVQQTLVVGWQILECQLWVWSPLTIQTQRLCGQLAGQRGTELGWGATLKVH